MDKTFVMIQIEGERGWTLVNLQQIAAVRMETIELLLPGEGWVKIDKSSAQELMHLLQPLSMYSDGTPCLRNFERS